MSPENVPPTSSNASSSSASGGQHLVSSKIDTQDIENLIALASRVSLLPSASENRLSPQEWFLPHTNVIFRAQRQQRFAKVLDSIANLSVAAPEHEVIAVALNVTSSSTNLYMAGNHVVPPNTVRHLNKLWSLLQDLSNDYEQYNQLPKSSDSPTQPQTSSLPLVAQKRVMQFRRDSLKFCCNKLNRRINKHYTSLLAIESTELSLIQQTVKGLATLMKDRDILSDRCWDLVWDGLSHLQVETTRLFRDNVDLSNLMAKTFPATRYQDSSKRCIFSPAENLFQNPFYHQYC